VCEALLINITNSCELSQFLSHQVLASGVFFQFISNNPKFLLENENIRSLLLSVIKNLTFYFDPDLPGFFKIQKLEEANQIQLFLFLVLEILSKEISIDSERQEEVTLMLCILDNLFNVPELSSELEVLYRKQSQFLQIIKAITGQLYNSRIQTMALKILSRLAWFTPTEELFQFQMMPLCHALDYVLKMNHNNQSIKQDVYYFLSNLVLNYKCLQVILSVDHLFEKTGVDYMNGSDDTRHEITIFLGNICHQLETTLVPALLNRNVLEILKMGFEFDNMKVNYLILQSLLLFFEKFYHFGDDLDENETNRILEFANDDDFIEKLESAEKKFLRQRNMTQDDTNSKEQKALNCIFDIREIMGL
jgi:hypothetical protein